MGNIKFRLSNMLPNAWLYKLRDMGKATTTSKKKKPSSTIQQQEKISSKTKQPFHSYTRKSYYFSRELATGYKRSCNSPRTNQKDTESTNSPKDTPRKSSKHKAAKRRVMLVKSSPSNKHVKSSVSAGYGCRKKPDDDQLLDISTSSPENIERYAYHSPRSYGKSIYSSSSNSRIGLSGSYAVVKASFDPQRDFQQSMMEMIVENNIKSSKDLEYLLACYLSVNSDEYHDLIIKVFKEIWCHLNGTK